MKLSRLKKVFSLVTMLALVLTLLTPINVMAKAKVSQDSTDYLETRISPKISRLKFQVIEDKVSFLFNFELSSEEQEIIQTYNASHPDDKAYLAAFLSWEEDIWSRANIKSPEDFSNGSKDASCEDWVLTQSDNISLKVCVMLGGYETFDNVSNTISYQVKEPEIYDAPVISNLINKDYKTISFDFSIPESVKLAIEKYDSMGKQNEITLVSELLVGNGEDRAIYMTRSLDEENVSTFTIEDDFLKPGDHCTIKALFHNRRMQKDSEWSNELSFDVPDETEVPKTETPETQVPSVSQVPQTPETQVPSVSQAPQAPETQVPSVSQVPQAPETQNPKVTPVPGTQIPKESAAPKKTEKKVKPSQKPSLTPSVKPAKDKNKKKTEEAVKNTSKKTNATKVQKKIIKNEATPQTGGFDPSMVFGGISCLNAIGCIITRKKLK